MSDGSKEEKLQHIFRLGIMIHCMKLKNVKIRIFDKDGSGSISADEMCSIVRHLYHLIPEKERQELGTPEDFTERIMGETDRNQVRLRI